MEPNTRKLLSGPVSPINKTSTLHGSHDVTLDPVLRNMLENPKDLGELISSEYHLTATIRNRSLSLRQLSLLTEVLEYQIVHFGCNFAMQLTLYELYFRIKGNAQNSEAVTDPKIRLTLVIAEILFGALRESEFSLYSGSLIKLSSTFRSLLSPYLMSSRTYGSRYRSWRPEKFVTVRAVPVDTVYERSSQKSERYSGYTKGYGESHGNARKQKTKPSYELDGDALKPDKPERNLIARMAERLHQLPNQLWIKYKNLTEES